MNEAALDSARPGHELAKRFQQRNHMRTAKELVLADNYVLVKAEGSSEGSRRAPDRGRFDKMKSDVRMMFGDQVVVDAPDHSATKMFTSHNMLVVLDDKTRYLDSVSEIVSGMSSRIWRGRIYADKHRRSEVREVCEKWLKDHPLTIAVEGGDQ